MSRIDPITQPMTTMILEGMMEAKAVDALYGVVIPINMHEVMAAENEHFDIKDKKEYRLNGIPIKVYGKPSNVVYYECAATRQPLFDDFKP